LHQHTPLLQEHATLLHQHTPLLQEHATLLHQHAPLLQEHATLLHQHTPLLQEHAMLLHQRASVQQLLSVIASIAWFGHGFTPTKGATDWPTRRCAMQLAPQWRRRLARNSAACNTAGGNRGPEWSLALAGLTLATSAPGLESPLPHKHQD
jgi:hypothetical protein